MSEHHGQPELIVSKEFSSDVPQWQDLQCLAIDGADSEEDLKGALEAIPSLLSTPFQLLFQSPGNFQSTLCILQTTLN